jgi:hypothetical protein
MRTLFFLFLAVLTSTPQGWTQDITEIKKKIQLAKETYYADRDKAEQKLMEALTRRETTAKQSGDIKLIEKTRSEIQEFRQSAKLPTTVPTRDYESALKTALTKLENSFLAGIKTLTQANRLEEAKELQQELLKMKQPAVKEDVEPIRAGSVWINEKQNHFVTFLEIKNNTYRGTYTSIHPGGRENIKKISGSFKDGKFGWLGKESFDQDGKNSEFDGSATLAKDDLGYRIDLIKTSGNYKEYFELRLQK